MIAGTTWQTVTLVVLAAGVGGFGLGAGVVVMGWVRDAVRRRNGRNGEGRQKNGVSPPS